MRDLAHAFTFHSPDGTTHSQEKQSADSVGQGSKVRVVLGVAGVQPITGCWEFHCREIPLLSLRQSSVISSPLNFPTNTPITLTTVVKTDRVNPMAY